MPVIFPTGGCDNFLAYARMRMHIMGAGMGLYSII